MPTLYTAERCPYAARARIALAEKGLDYDAVEIDLSDRPAWLYGKNPLGRVPVYEEDGGLVLPESVVIMEYLEERYPEPALWPADPAERALGRLLLVRFDDLLGDAYYAVRRGEPREQLDGKLAELDRVLEGRHYLSGREYGLADIGYVPWILRAFDRFGERRLDGAHPRAEAPALPVPEAGNVELGPSLAGWLERLLARPAVAAEREVVAAL